MLYKEVQHVRFRCKRPVTVRRCAHDARLEFTTVEGVVASRRVKYRNKAKSAWTRIITGLIWIIIETVGGVVLGNKLADVRSNWQHVLPSTSTRLSVQTNNSTNDLQLVLDENWTNLLCNRKSRFVDEIRYDFAVVCRKCSLDLPTICIPLWQRFWIRILRHNKPT